MRFGSVYLIKNLQTGKCYVGQTKNSIISRFSSHAKDRRSSRYLSVAIQKHGKYNFSIEELFIAFDEYALNESETLLIEAYQSLYPNGYNLCLGGHSRGIISEVTRLKMRQAKIGTSYRKGKSVSIEDRIKASRQRGGTSIRATNIDSNQVVIYDSVYDVCRNGFNSADVYRVLNKKRTHTKRWKFERITDNQSGRN